MFIILIMVYSGATVAMLSYYHNHKITTLYAFKGGRAVLKRCVVETL